MIERQRVLFLLLLLRAHVLQLFGQQRRVLLQLLQRSGQRVGFPLACFHLRAELAQLALQRQRTAARLPAAAHRVAVIADAVRQQEVGVRMFATPAAAPPRDPRPGSTCPSRGR